MDINIDDILDDFVKGSSHTNLKESDYELLQQAWINERMAPEILPYEFGLLQRVLERVSGQLEFLEMNAMDDRVSSERKLQLMVVESELDRVNFIVRSYLRCRLAKIDKFTVWLRTRYSDTQQTDELGQLMAPEEVQYMESHFKILLELYNASFLKNLPQQLQAMDDTSGGVSMVEEPQDTSVFVYVVKGEHNVVIEDEEIDLKKGEIYVIRWSAVRDLVLQGDVVLI